MQDAIIHDGGVPNLLKLMKETIAQTQVHYAALQATQPQAAPAQAAGGAAPAEAARGELLSHLSPARLCLAFRKRLKSERSGVKREAIVEGLV